MGLDGSSICEKHECICAKNHTKFEHNGKIICRKIVEKGDECHNHNDCVPFKGEQTMKCKEQKCECDDDYELYDAYSKKCVKKVIEASSAPVIFRSIYIVFYSIFTCLIAEILI